MLAVDRIPTVNGSCKSFGSDFARNELRIFDPDLLWEFHLRIARFRIADHTVCSGKVHLICLSQEQGMP